MRKSGILLHISSLPSEYGIGKMGREAYRFADFLAETKTGLWQILPLSPTSYGDSPYQSFSAFAGNPYFIDFELLEKDGLLKKNEYTDIKWEQDKEKIDYEFLYENVYKVLRKAYSRFEQEFERRPSAEELAEELDMPIDKIAEVLRMQGRHVSMDAPFVDGEDNSLIDVMENQDSPRADRGLINESLTQEIDRALATLSEREQRIIRKFFGVGSGVQEKTLEEIGEEEGLTRERVRQIKEKALHNLAQNSRSKVLRTYLG